MLDITTPTPHTTGTARSADGIAIPYRIFGNGPQTLLLVHGWCCDQTIWGNQVAALSDDHMVVTLDLASHGQAGKRQDAWPMDAFVDDALAVMRAIDRPSWTLVGHSLGGILVTKLAARAPEQTAAVVVVDAIKHPDEKMAQGDIDAMLGFLAADWVRNVKTWLPDAAYAADTPRDVRTCVDGTLQAADPTMAVESMRDFLAQDHAALLRAIPDIPLKLMNAVHPDEQSADFDKFHPDCAVTPFEGAGHFVMLEHPKVFNAALRTLLSDVQASSLSQSTTRGALT